MALRRSSKWCGPGPFRGLCQRAGGRRTGATGNVTGLELAEVEFVASDAEVFDDVRDDATWHIAGMPGKGDEPVGSERIGVVPVAARRAEHFAADFPGPPLQLATVLGWVPARLLWRLTWLAGQPTLFA